MSTKQCRYFVQHAWKQKLCANCFELREEHERASKERLQMCLISSKISSDKKVNDKSLQSILRRNRNDNQLSSVELRRKNVAFLDSLTEIIGYGGYDGSYDEDSEIEEDFQSINGDAVDKIQSLDDESNFVPDTSDEDKALINLTRENTNFNRVIHNLTESASSDNNTSLDLSRKINESSKKNFTNLMLGNIQKDDSGKKTTLIVSVTPFQSDSLFPNKPERNFAKQSQLDGGHRIINSKKDAMDIAKSFVKDDDNKFTYVNCEKLSLTSNINNNNSNKLMNSSQKPLLHTSVVKKQVSDNVNSDNTEENKLVINTSKGNCNNKNNLNSNNNNPLNCNEYSATISKKSVAENCNMNDAILDHKKQPQTDEEKKDKETIAQLKPRTSEIKSSNSPAIASTNSQDALLNNCNRDYNSKNNENINKSEIKTPSNLCTIPPTDYNNDYDGTTTPTAKPRKSFLHSKINTKSESPKVEISDDSIKSSTDDIDIKLPDESLKNSNECDQRYDSMINNESLIINNSNEQKKNTCHTIDDHEQMNDEKNVPKLLESSNNSLLSQENSLYSSVYTKNPISNIKSDCPVVREKEKRERNSLCNPKFTKTDDELNQYHTNIYSDISNVNDKSDSLKSTQECMGSLSDSECCLAVYYSTDSQLDSKNTRLNKKKNKTQYFFKKFLRIGASRRREINIASNTFTKDTECLTNSSSPLSSTSPHAKSKFKISHPHKLDRNSTVPEVLRHKKLINNDSKKEFLRLPTSKSINSSTDNFHLQSLAADLKQPLATNNNVQMPESNCLNSSDNDSSILLLSYNTDDPDDSDSLTNILKEAADGHPSWRSLTSGMVKMKSYTNDTVFVDSGKFRSIQCN